MAEPGGGWLVCEGGKPPPPPTTNAPGGVLAGAKITVAAAWPGEVTALVGWR